MNYSPVLDLPRIENTSRVLEKAVAISVGLHVLLLAALGPIAIFKDSAPPYDPAIMVELIASPQHRPVENISANVAAQPELPRAETGMREQRKKARTSKPETATRSRTGEKKRASMPAKGANQEAGPPGKQGQTPGVTGGQTLPPALAVGSSRRAPQYPELARKRGQEGEVKVRCQVDSTGRVAGVSIAMSSGSRLLDEAALKAVAKWKFEPGKKDGVNVAGSVIVPVRFELK